MTDARCRLCRAPLLHVFADLGMSPLANAYLRPERLGCMEPFYPLRALVCDRCFLVQLEAFASPEQIFSDYAYYSSYSTTWLEHCRAYVDAATERFHLGPDHLVVELASNDGYLLQFFARRGIRVLGVEPAANVASAAVARGVPTEVVFFGRDTATQLAAHGQADLMVGNNVLAHVPDLNDFIAGIKILLKPGGVATLEFPHLLRLIDQVQFDTMYHEHLSYFSFITAQRAFASHGLTLFDVEELATHGGSLRIYARHSEDQTLPVSDHVAELSGRERAAGLNEIESYRAFDERVRKMKRELLGYLIRCKDAGLAVVGYGAPAKGNTLLNYCGIGTDFIDYTVDLSPHKQGLFLPGTHISIRSPEELARTRPDLLFILPWNLNDEIMQQMGMIRTWGGRFLVRTPEIRELA